MKQVITSLNAVTQLPCNCSRELMLCREHRGRVQLPCNCNRLILLCREHRGHLWLRKGRYSVLTAYCLCGRVISGG
jgi:hypothetical protein